MSGIAGVWTTEPRDLKELSVFTDMLENRGPAGRGFLTADDKRLGFGQRWLAPLGDDTFSDYPLVSHDNRYAIVFDGEIHNRSEIRRDLETLGHQFKTDSDSELALQAFAEWGAPCQNRFNGEWAFGIWDNSERSLFLSRDRVGHKPLIYVQNSEGFAFASARKAFFALPWLNTSDGQLSLESDNFEVITPGSFAVLRNPRDSVKSRRWWFPMEHIKRETAPYAEQVEKFRELLLDACRIRLKGNTPVAASISGGLDSSAIVSMISAIQNSPGEESQADSGAWKGAFTATAKGTTHDELKYALSACESAGMDPYIVDVLRDFDPDDIEEFLYHSEGLELNYLTSWYLKRSMREHGVAASIDGHGADGIMVGEHLDVYGVMQFDGSWLRRPLRTLEMAKIGYNVSVGSPYIHKNSSIQILMKLALLSTPPLRGLYRRLPGRDLDFPKIEVDEAGTAELWDMARTLPPAHQWSFMKWFNSSKFQRDRFDRLGMSSQIQIRYPFMDWRLVSYVFSLPPTSVLGGGYTKRILRDSVKSDLPPDVVTRKEKLRLEGAVPSLLQNPLRDWMLSLATDTNLCNDILDSGRYREILGAGRNAVNRWNAEHFPLVAAKHATALRARFDADPQATLRAVRNLG